MKSLKYTVPVTLLFQVISWSMAVVFAVLILAGCDRQSVTEDKWAAAYQKVRASKEKADNRAYLVWLLDELQQGLPSSTDAGRTGIHELKSAMNNEDEASFSNAVLLLEKAVSQKDSEAMVWLGQMYVKRLGVEQDYAHAKQLFEQAWEQGNPGGAYYLGTLYWEGLGVKKDNKKALEYLRAAKREGYMLAGIGVAELDIWEGRYISARLDLERYRQRGFPQAMLALAELYRNGAPSINADPQKSVSLLREALDMGWGEAAEILYSYYLNGVAVKKDPDKAFYYLEQAADLGQGDSQAFLCGTYAKGKLGVPVDFRKAKKYCDMAVSSGSIYAGMSQAALYYNENYPGYSVEMGKQWLLKTANSGNPRAMDTIARHYLHGVFGFEKNVDKAYSWSKQAAEAGWPPAMGMAAWLSLDEKHDITELNGPSWDACWYWATIMDLLSTGKTSKLLRNGCESHLSESYREEKKLAIDKKVKEFRVNSWTNIYLTETVAGRMRSFN